jgi:hypothetical protein
MICRASDGDWLNEANRSQENWPTFIRSRPYQRHLQQQQQSNRRNQMCTLVDGENTPVQSQRHHHENRYQSLLLQLFLYEVSLLLALLLPSDEIMIESDGVRPLTFFFLLLGMKLKTLEIRRDDAHAVH